MGTRRSGRTLPCANSVQAHALPYPCPLRSPPPCAGTAIHLWFPGTAQEPPQQRWYICAGHIVVTVKSLQCNSRAPILSLPRMCMQTLSPPKDIIHSPQSFLLQNPMRVGREVDCWGSLRPQYLTPCLPQRLVSTSAGIIRPAGASGNFGEIGGCRVWEGWEDEREGRAESNAAWQP